MNAVAMDIVTSDTTFIQEHHPISKHILLAVRLCESELVASTNCSDWLGEWTAPGSPASSSAIISVPTIQLREN